MIHETISGSFAGLFESIRGTSNLKWISISAAAKNNAPL
jgi:hypothetical protein